MTTYYLPYGTTSLTFDLPDHWPVEVIAPRTVQAAKDPPIAVKRALDEPVGGVALEDFTGARSAAIAINDKTRPVPHGHLLPTLLRRLEEMGLAPNAITLVIATGTHAPMARGEFLQVVPPDILNRYRVICHDAGDQGGLVFLGQTSRGTPLWINRSYLQADLRLAVGNIEPHQFMGFSGGVKSAVIGLAGRETIGHNHALMADQRSRLGAYGDNPARLDVEEMGEMLGVHFALNAVLNQEKEIVHVLAGQPRAVMGAGIPLVRQAYQIPVSAPFDLLIVSPGGHPKDINVYQAQKALGHASLVSRPGGVIIVAAACPEGSGSLSYQDWVTGMTSHQAVIERFRHEGFRVGPHKAFQIARDSVGRRVLWITDMAPDLAKRLLLYQVASLGEALSSILPSLSPEARVGIMPLANATIPVLEDT